MIFPLIRQTIITALMMSTGGEGACRTYAVEYHTGERQRHIERKWSNIRQQNRAKVITNIVLAPWATTKEPTFLSVTSLKINEL